jgi:S-DNA-T family DNA segregation ATPase FtsK/SpoIIIE
MAEKTSFQSLVSNKDFVNSEMVLPLVLGVDSDNKPVYADLVKMPHLLVCGHCGSFLQSVIMSILHTECKLLLIDTKGGELADFNGVQHLIEPIITEQDKAEKALEWIVNEIDNRYKTLISADVQNIKEYNQKHKDAMPYIVVVIDELADLLESYKDEVPGYIQKIAMKAKAAGIHLVAATQWVDDIGNDSALPVSFGEMYTNLPTRITFQLRTKEDSELVLGESGAENLSQGEMLYSERGKKPVRVNVPWINELDIKKFVNNL